MRALVTGADGFIGSALCSALVAAGHQVTGACPPRLTRQPAGSCVAYEYGDVTDAAYVSRIINASEADWVFHLAAVSIVRIAAKDPSRALRTNIVGTMNVLEACRANGVVACVVASSDKAYGDSGGETYTEDTPLRPTGPYEVSKACADLIAQLYGRCGTRAMVVRGCNVFGPGDLNYSRLIPGACRAVVNGRPPTVYESAWQNVREWVDVESVARAYIAVAEHGAAGHAYNIGTGWIYNSGDVAMMIAGMADVPAPVSVQSLMCYEIPAQQIDASRLRRLGWLQSEAGFVAELHRTFEWYREHTCAS